MSARVRAVVNGEAVEMEAGTRLVDFLGGRGIDAARIAVERARVVVPRGQHASVVVEEGDVFEVVHFVGGG